MSLEDPALAALAAANHESWFAAWATHDGGTASRRFGGMLAYAEGQAANVGFPRLAASEAGPFADEVVEIARRHRAREVGWWALDDATNGIVGPALLARGFRWGWRPRWMVYDLRQDEAPRRPVPSGIEIVEADAPVDFGTGTDVPYAGPTTPGADGRIQPPGVWTWVALEDDRRVGNISLHVADGAGPENQDRAHGGLYSCGVAPRARRRGIGAALTAVLLSRARELGCRYVTLNATPEGELLYRAGGFRVVGDGQTWWLTGRTIQGEPIPRAAIAFAEAVGTGDLDAIDRALAHAEVDLEEPLACALTPVQVAVQADQPAAADRLLAHGAVLDVLSACDLGRKREVPALLAAHPELLHRRDPDFGATPLHLAVQREDLELAEMLIAAGADRSMTDSAFGATPLGWARHLDKPEFVRLLADDSGTTGNSQR